MYLSINVIMITALNFYCLTMEEMDIFNEKSGGNMTEYSLMLSVQNKNKASPAIRDRIFCFRGQQVMIDRDIAELYQIETKVLNQTVKRNIERFPDTFRFQLNDHEKNELVTYCDRLAVLKHSAYNPYVYSEQGVSMLSAVLKSKIAVHISIQIMKTFVELRKWQSANHHFLQRMDHLENRQICIENKFDEVLKAFDHKGAVPEQGIFFGGQVFDAFIFVSDLIRSAKHSIVLVDNYIDEQVLKILSKKKIDVEVLIVTAYDGPYLDLAVKRFNEQFSGLKIRIFKHSHDRFLIIDNKEVYHIGASLKDLGKKCFAFSKLKIPPERLLNEFL